MSKNAILILVVIGLVVGGYLYVSRSPSNQSSDAVMTVKDEMVKPVDPAMGAVNQDEQSSRYLPFTPAALADSISTRRVLFFYASWCPTCIPADADFKENVSLLPTDVTVIRVNYNDPDTDAQEKSLAKKYGVTYQHTYVQIDSNGNEVSKWNGGSSKELLAKIK